MFATELCRIENLTGLLFPERGHCHAALGDPTLAIESFELAVELNPALRRVGPYLNNWRVSPAGRSKRASRYLSKLEELPLAIVETFAAAERIAQWREGRASTGFGARPPDTRS